MYKHVLHLIVQYITQYDLRKERFSSKLTVLIFPPRSTTQQKQSKKHEHIHMCKAIKGDIEKFSNSVPKYLHNTF